MPPARTAQGNDDASSPGTTVRLFLTSTALPPAYNARTTKGTWPAGLLARIADAPDGLRPLPTLKPGRQDLDPGAFDLDPLRGRSRAQVRELDPELGDLTLLDKARLDVDVRPCTFCRHEREKRR